MIHVEGLAPAAMLDLWTDGDRSSAADRAHALLGAARPGLPAEQQLAMGVGSRDAALLALRRAMFGDVLSGVVRCPICGTQLVVELAVDDVLVIDLDDEGVARRTEVVIGDVVVEARAPSHADLMAAGRCPDEVAAREVLISRCIERVVRRGDREQLATEVLDAAAVAVVGDAIAALDPQVEVTVALDCALCRHPWEPLLDIATFLWAEVDAAGNRLVDELHELASAYGWNEQEVLALSPARRRRYIERLRSA